MGAHSSKRVLKDFTGEVFTRLTIMSEVPKKEKSNHRRFKCSCECGNVVEVDSSSLKYGLTRSCGCLRRETTATNHTTHGRTKNRTVELLHTTWSNIKTRCYNPNFKDFSSYGGKGIKVCEEWLNDYEVFRTWALNNRYIEGLSIERKNPSKDYCPENCEWITQSENSKRAGAPRRIVNIERNETIKKMRKETSMSYAKLGSHFGLSTMTIYKICNR